MSYGVYLPGGAQGVICVRRLWDELLIPHAQKRRNHSEAYDVFCVLHRESINAHGSQLREEPGTTTRTDGEAIADSEGRPSAPCPAS